MKKKELFREKLADAIRTFKQATLPTGASQDAQEYIALILEKLEKNLKHLDQGASKVTDYSLGDRSRLFIEAGVPYEPFTRVYSELNDFWVSLLQDVITGKKELSTVFEEPA